MSLPGELLRIKAAATNTCSSHGEATVRLSFHVGHCQLHLWGCWELLPHRTARSSISPLELSSGSALHLSWLLSRAWERGCVSKEVGGKGPLVSLCPPWGSSSSQPSTTEVKLPPLSQAHRGICTSQILEGQEWDFI